jgi:serine/threonine protein phosphatase 1
MPRLPAHLKQIDDRIFESNAGVAGQIVYAVGDVHGRYDLLRSLLGTIARHADDHAQGRRPILVFCGDYIDRGPDSAKVIDTLLWLRRHGEFELHLLKGNHEQACLAFIDHPELNGEWLHFGGLEALESYGVAPPDAEDMMDYRRARDDLLARMPAAHLHLMQTLQLMIGIGDFAFVHAGVRPGRLLAEQDEADLLWIRRDFLDVSTPFEKIIVHGHSWADDRPVINPVRIGLDTGAFRTGTLTAVCLQDGRIETLQARSATLSLVA